jgi:D-alanine-D-alanine ligase
MTQRVRIAVVAGGRSSEHAISLASARSVIEALDPERYDVVTLLIDETGGWQVVHGAPALLAASEGAAPAGSPGTGVARAGSRAPSSAPTARARARSTSCSPVLHGPFGEDGRSGPARDSRLPYVGAGVLGSAASMSRSARRCCAMPASPSRAPRAASGVDDPLTRSRRRVAELGWPVFVKPANLGSSVGITKVHGPDELADARARVPPRPQGDRRGSWQGALSAGLGNERHRVRGRRDLPHAEWYDYSAVRRGGSDIIAPADLPVAVAERVRTVPRPLPHTDSAAWPASTSSSPQGEVLVNEVNTIPGFRPRPSGAALRRCRRDVSRGARPARAERPRPPRAARALPLLIHSYAAVSSCAP